MIKFNRNYFIKTLVGILLVTIMIHVIGWNSDAMIEAKKFISNSSEVAKNIGEVRGIYMIPFSSNIKIRNNEGDAHVQLLVVGTYVKFSHLDIKLKSTNNVWQVSSAVATGNHTNLKFK